MSSGIEDEPALNGIAPGGGSDFDPLYGEDALAGTEAAEADRARHKAYLRAMWSEPPSARRAAFVLGVCAVSGLLAVACALFKGTIGVFALSVTVGAPVIEEMAKVALTLWALEKSPWKFRSASEIVLACIASAAVFAAIENVLYIYVYIPKDRLTSGIILYRLTVCTALHIVCTSITSVGLARGWREAKARLGEFKKARAMPFLVAAMILHGLHNAGAILWSIGEKL